MTVTIKNSVGSLWATPEELAAMTDEQIVELIREDITEFLDGAEWQIDREAGA